MIFVLTDRGVVLGTITKLPAKYMDPLTDLPYANLAAFKEIRAKLAKGEIKLPEWKIEAHKAKQGAEGAASLSAAAPVQPEPEVASAAKAAAAEIKAEMAAVKTEKAAAKKA